jgi:hypothetical protein
MLSYYKILNQAGLEIKEEWLGWDVMCVASTGLNKAIDIAEWPLYIARGQSFISSQYCSSLLF